ncbi:MAG: thiamine-phosphate kinase [Gemmatimonadetes bacterium]|nr:thiamine-phosphate kinase [Gemmatimonadota bacterium]MDA1104280.1 thiamine-phosphate kinase [Gemmatimonadota bacterium]
MKKPVSKCVRLGPGAEFDLIRSLVGEESDFPAEVRVGPGDDAAVLEGGWVVSTDLAVEDVHFRRAWLTDEEIGYRAGAAALSDIAAMAASPVALLLSIAAPRGGAVDVRAVQAGVQAVARTVGACVIGGDISRSPGPLMLDVVALGRSTWPVLRDGAEPGDHVWVTGTLGASAAAVQAWESGGEPSAELRAAFTKPTPRVEAARCLVEHEVVDAMIDISDGLAGDLGHLAAASGVQITLEAALIPVASAALEALGPDRALEAALHGGEDYELCFVTDPGVVDAEYFLTRHGLKVTRVGSVSSGSGVWMESAAGERKELSRGGFDHWADLP